MIAGSRRYRLRPISGLSLAVAASLTALLAVAFEAPSAWAQSVNVYGRTATGDVVPLRMLQGGFTKLSLPEGDDVDPAHSELWVANNGTHSIDVYSRAASGNAAPLRSIVGPATGLNRPVGVDVDTVNDEVFVANALAPSITVYPRAASGNVAPIRTIGGAATGITNPFVAVVDTVNNEIFVLNVQTQTIEVFSRTANGDVAPLRTISGAATTLVFAQDLAVAVDPDPVKNELIVTDTSANKVLVFSRTASGNVAPIRTISGPATGLATPVGVAVDLVNHEIFVVNSFNGANSVTVYSRTASGDVAPLRTIKGQFTQLQTPLRIAVDPANNEIFVTVRDTVAGIPTLSEWGVVAMIALILFGAFRTLRRRSAMVGRTSESTTSTSLI